MELGCFASLGPQDVNMRFYFISSQNQENSEQMQNSPDSTTLETGIPIETSNCLNREEKLGFSYSK